MLSERADAHDLEVLNSIAVPTLVVIDYAETRLHQLAAVFEALTNAEVKVRCYYWPVRRRVAHRTVAPSPRLELLADDRIVLELGPLEPTPEGRAHAWDEAAHSFAARLGEPRRLSAIDWPALVTRMDQPRLDGPSAIGPSSRTDARLGRVAAARRTHRGFRRSTRAGSARP